MGLTAEQGKDVEAILDALEDYFKPARNVIFERYVFGNCKQDEGEPIDAFVTKLREKAASCEYGQLREELIRDRLVLGVSDEGVHRRLLREKGLTLASAIDICRAAEMTYMRIKAITQDRSLETVHATDSRRPRFPHRQDRSDRSQHQPPPPGSGENENTSCRFCGNMHRRGRDLCPAFGKTCRHCGTANHFAKVCMKRGQATRQLHAADMEAPDDTDRSDTDAHIYTTQSIGAVQGQGKKWFANIKMNGGSQRCQLDSGATCDVMSIKDMRRLAPHAKLLPSQTRLVLYSGQSMQSIGIFHTECVVRGKAHKLQFEIVRTGQRPLLSGETSERLGLVHFTIPEELLMVGHGSTEPLTRQHLVQTYSDVFNEPVESLPGDVHFELHADVTPVQCLPT